MISSKSGDCLAPLGDRFSHRLQEGLRDGQIWAQNWLHESYEKWEAFLDQFGTARMDEPGVAGHWSMKDIIVHLTGWDQYVVARVQAARRGEPEPPPPWPADLQNDDEINAWLYERNHGRR